MLEITLLDDGTIQLTSEAIQEMIDNIADYSQVTINATINCCPEIFSDTQILGPDIETDMFVITSDSIIVNPAFFMIIPPEKIKDGVYHFETKLFKLDNTYVFEENCAFIDVTYRCLVAANIKNLLDKSEDGQCATNIHILHYALVNGSNCNCNCQAMCDVFKELKKLLIPIPLQPQGCGCN